MPQASLDVCPEVTAETRSERKDSRKRRLAVTVTVLTVSLAFALTLFLLVVEAATKFADARASLNDRLVEIGRSVDTASAFVLYHYDLSFAKSMMQDIVDAHGLVAATLHTTTQEAVDAFGPAMSDPFWNTVGRWVYGSDMSVRLDVEFEIPGVMRGTVGELVLQPDTGRAARSLTLQLLEGATEEILYNVILGLALALLLHVFVVRRIVRLQKALAALGPGESKQDRIPEILSSDEIGDLARRVADHVETTAGALSQARAAGANEAASAKRLQQVLDNSFQGIVIHRDFRPLFANQAYARLCGYDSPDEILALGSILPFFSAADVDAAQDNLQRLEEDDLYLAPQIAMNRRRDGTLFPVQIQDHLIDWEGHPAILVTVIDVSTEFEAQAQLARKTAQLEGIITAMPSGLLVLDSDLNILISNDKYGYVTAVPQKLVLRGTPLVDLVALDAIVSGLEPERARARAVKLVEQFKANPERPVVRRTSTGRSMLVQGLRQSDGTYICTFTDITDREQATNELKTAKASAERALHGLRLLFDAADQGFLSVGTDLIVAAEYSRAAALMLGCDPFGQALDALLFPDAVDERKRNLLTKTGVAALCGDDELVRDMLLSLLPKATTIGGRSIEIAYRPAGPGRLLVVLTDVTDEKRLEERVTHERLQLEMIVGALTDREMLLDVLDDFDSFLMEILETRTVNGAEAQESLDLLYRQVHTFKGLFRQLSFNDVPKALHRLEDRLDDLKRRGGAEALLAARKAVDEAGLGDALASDLESLETVLGRDFRMTGGGLVLSQETADRLRRLAGRIARRLPDLKDDGLLAEVVQTLEPIGLSDLRQLLVPHARVVPRIAAQLHKEIDEVRIEGDPVLVPAEIYLPFLKTLVHVFRNAVDHGIETPDERVDAGKPEAGKIRCRVSRRDDWIQITIEDDGRGINDERLRTKAIDLGLKTAAEAMAMSREEAFLLVFADHVSTARVISEISGRGIGLAAVLAQARALGGDVRIGSEPGRGTVFTFTLPFIGGLQALNDAA